MAEQESMTTPSPAELALLCLMAEVGVPLRIGQLSQAHFLGRQGVAVGFGAGRRLNLLYHAGYVELRHSQVKPPWASDYVLTDKGREAAGSG